ncbi:MAPEG family protein [Nitratireductor sp. CH_MIT9313-5]|jgi:uncharacterized membrane protein YecN with MAPEG domain|uniref:MAPEG family protein n=1 Tax=Nitratireductor sp. CH_MIT9313-5 TaxID=3107764 RepID=UPI00300BDF5D
MIFTVTPIYALGVSVIYLILWFRVTAMRGGGGISIGDGENRDLLLRIRQHGNCAEWSTFILILMLLAEGMDAPDLYLHLTGALLLVGRITHPFGLKADNAGHVLRYVGNGTNILAALTAMICIAANLAGF